MGKQITKEMSFEEVVGARKELWMFMMINPEHQEPVEDLEQFNVDYNNMIKAEIERDGIDWNGLGAAKQTMAMNRWENTKSEDHLESLKKLNVPTLVMHGKYDYLIPIEFGLQLSSLIPGSKMYEYRGGHNFGHPSHPEILEAILSEIISFFKMH